MADIVDNPKKLKIIEIDAAQTPRSLDDVDAAAINTNYAVDAEPRADLGPILREDPKGPYVNLIAVREADKDKPWVKTLLETYHSPEVKAFVAERFKGVGARRLVGLPLPPCLACSCSQATSPDARASGVFCIAASGFIRRRACRHLRASASGRSPPAP